MGVAVDREYGQVFFAHHPDAELWAAETTLSGADPFPGAAVIDDDAIGSMFWDPLGDYDATGAEFTVEVRDGGHPDGGLTYTWSDGTDTYGYDEPMQIGHVSAVVYTNTGVARNAELQLVEAGDGSLICITADAASVISTSVPIYRKTGSTDWANVSGTVGGGATSSSVSMPSGVGAFPAACRLADGTVLCAVCRRLGQGFFGAATVVADVYRAEADAAWSSSPFTLLAPGAVTDLPTTNGRMRMAAGNGQVVLLANDSGTLLQYRSVDAGQSFVLVDSSAVSGFDDSFDLIFALGVFWLVHYDGSGNVVVRKIGDGTIAFADAGSTQVVAASGLYAGGLSIVEDETGGLIVVLQALGKVIAYTSRNAGTSWSGTSTVPIMTMKTTTTAENVANLDAVWWRGRLVLVHTADNVAGYTHSVGSLELGGWASFSMPYDRSYPFLRAAMESPWTCASDPNNATNPAVSSTGTVTEAPDASEYAYSVSCAIGATWQIGIATSTGYTLNGMVLRTIVKVSAGPVRHTVHWSDGSAHDFGVYVDQTSTGLTVLDAVGGGTLATATVSGWLEIVMVATSDGDGHVWYRSATSTDARAYVHLLSSTSLVDGSGGTTTAAANSAMNSSDAALWRLWSGLRAGPAYTWFTDTPYARRASSRGTWTTNGVRLVPRLGPGIPGDGWTVTPTSQTGPEYAAGTATYPSRRKRLESAAYSTGDAIAWKVETTSTTGSPPTTKLWGTWVETNAATVILDWRINGVGDGGSWQTGPVIKAPDPWTGTCQGRVVYASAAAGSSAGFWVEEDELAGGYVVLDGVPVKILRNTSGHVKAKTGVTSKLLTVTVEDGHDGEAATYLWWPRSTHVVDTDDMPDNIAGFRLRVTGTDPPEGTVYLKAVSGPAYLIPQQPGRDSRRETAPKRSRTEAENGFRLGRETGPAEDTLTITWQNEPDPWAYQVSNAPSLAYVYDGSSYVTSGAGDPLAAMGDTGSQMAALFRRWGSTETPVVYVPSWYLAVSVQQQGNGRGAIIGTIEGVWTQEHASHGREGVDPTMRYGQVVIRELS